jgi:hypothetical protein
MTKQCALYSTFLKNHVFLVNVVFYTYVLLFILHVSHPMRRIPSLYLLSAGSES